MSPRVDTELKIFNLAAFPSCQNLKIIGPRPVDEFIWGQYTILIVLLILQSLLVGAHAEVTIRKSNISALALGVSVKGVCALPACPTHDHRLCGTESWDVSFRLDRSIQISPCVQDLTPVINQNRFLKNFFDI